MRWYAVIQYFLIVLAVMHLVQYGLTLKAYGNGSSTLLACGVIICGLLAGYSLLKYSQISLASNKDAVITEMRSSGYTYSYKGPLIQKWMDTVKAQGRAYTLYDVTIMDAIADGPSKEMQCPS